MNNYSYSPTPKAIYPYSNIKIIPKVEFIIHLMRSKTYNDAIEKLKILENEYLNKHRNNNKKMRIQTEIDRMANDNIRFITYLEDEDRGNQRKIYFYEEDSGIRIELFVESAGISEKILYFIKYFINRKLKKEYKMKFCNNDIEIYCKDFFGEREITDLYLNDNKLIFILVHMLTIIFSILGSIAIYIKYKNDQFTANIFVALWLFFLQIIFHFIINKAGEKNLSWKRI